MYFKIFWILRALIYKPFFGTFQLPSYLGKPIFIGGFKKIFIGSRVRIFPGARIEVIGEVASITFEDNISIGQNLHIISGTNLVIGKNSTFAENVFIASIEHSYEDIGVHVMEQPNVIKETQIGENCFIGYGAVIQAGTILGKQCVVGANSVVRGTFPDYCVIVGAPARIVKRYDQLSKQWRRTDSEGNFIDEV